MNDDTVQSMCVVVAALGGGDGSSQHCGRVLRVA